MVDDEHLDEKIIAIPFSDPMYNTYKDISELPSHIFDEMRHFFTVYKSLENMSTAVQEVKDCHEAMRIIEESMENYKTQFYYIH
jgi:inorganic pyrophosphatase